MRSQKTQVKAQNKLLFCELCGFIALSEEELNHHVKMSHFDDDDDLTELEFENMRKEKPYDSYLRICKSRACVIRPQIDIADTKDEVRRLYKDYCLTCTLHRYLFDELKKEGKI